MQKKKIRYSFIITGEKGAKLFQDACKKERETKKIVRKKKKS